MAQGVRFALTDLDAMEQSASEDWLESLSDELLAQPGCLSVTVDDCLADSQAEQAIFGEPGSTLSMRPWGVSQFTVLVSEDISPRHWWANVQVSLPALAQVEAEPFEWADADWVLQSQSQFEPIAISPRLWVGPHWHEVPAQWRVPGAVALRIDPGRAFGTGGHATTRLCLQALDRLVQPGMRVLDLGCGSGILAIAAKRLGAGYVAAVDIDEVALETTRQNIALNGLSNGDVAVLHASEPMFADFDLVVANILAQPLKLMAPLIWSRTRPQGAFLIAGLLSRQ
ncbi:MAG: hypothetical protein RLY67_1093, partial [Pseudomonadota bacterium]